MRGTDEKCVQILVGKPRYRDAPLEYNIKNDIKEVRCGGLI